MTATTHQYVFDNDTAEAADQLRHLGDLLDRPSIEALTSTGVTAGWRCWDVGAGAGTLATWLADTVGASGSVLATDIKPQHIPARDNLEVRVHDVRTDARPGSFDLIHARLVLMHLPERDEVLARLADALAPGGVLVVSDWYAVDPTSLVVRAPSEEAAAVFTRFQAILQKLAERVGMDMTWARRTNTAFHDVGLGGIETVVVSSAMPGGSPGCLLHHSNSHQLEAPLKAVGMTDADLALLRELLLDPEFVAWSYQLFTTSGRKAG